jgi:dolichol-phosphate mannosyltransferase
MDRISLVVPVSANGAFARLDLEAYRRALCEHGPFAHVEVVLAGDLLGQVLPPPGDDLILVETLGAPRVSALRLGMEAATGDPVVVVDPNRPYPPEALLQVVDRLLSSPAEVAIAVPGQSKLSNRGIALAARLALGTADIFSGLMAVRRGHLRDLPMPNQAYGTRLVLDLLSWPCDGRVDVPVTTHTNDRALRLGRPRLDDFRQLKRVLDHRFGTFSRLVQFCMVGASGMVVDLTFYALFQLLFARIWPIPTDPTASRMSWALTAAGALSIFIALIWNFTLNRRLTFNDARQGSTFRQFLAYALGNALGIAVSLFLRVSLPMRVAFFARHRLAAAVVGIVIATGISFSMSRWVVFIRRPEDSSRSEDSGLPGAPAPSEAIGSVSRPSPSPRPTRLRGRSERACADPSSRVHAQG